MIELRLDDSLDHHFATRNNKFVYFGPFTDFTYLPGLAMERVPHIPTLKLSWIFSRNSEFTKMFNYWILKNWQKGARKKRENQYNLFDSDVEGKSKAIEDVTMLGFENLSFPFIALLGGCFSALLVSLAKRFKKAKEKLFRKYNIKCLMK